MTDAPLLLVACLCAEWCGTCRDYRPLLAQLGRDLAGRVTTAWVDIEDDGEVPGEIDIDDFPTLLIARGDAVLFFGSVTPHQETLARLVRSALDGALAVVDDPALIGLPHRVRALRA